MIIRYKIYLLLTVCYWFILSPQREGVNHLKKEIDVGFISRGILTSPMLGLGFLLSQTQGSLTGKL